MRAGLLVLVLVTLPLAGCIGSGGSAGPSASPSAPDEAGDDPRQTPDGTTNASDEPGEASGSETGSQEETARVPTDAMDADPVETGDGWAHFQMEESSRFAFGAFFALVLEAGPCEDNVGPAPVGGRCSRTYNLTLQGDVEMIEVRLTWESERTDLFLGLSDPNGKTIDEGRHGQVFINDVCDATVGSCLYFFPPNGTTWEYVALGADKLQPDGAWSITVRDQNNWETGHVQGMAGGEGPTYTLDVWVYTVSAEPTHNPLTEGDGQ